MNDTTRHTKPTEWTIDPMHSSVSFRVRHLMITNVHGEFERVTGTVRFDPARPLEAEVRADIPAASVHTRVEQRDAHLRGAEFFDAERHPVITFRSTGVRATGTGRLEVKGDLSMRGETREVTLAVGEFTPEQRDHQGALRMGASATATVRRSDFGMTYNRVLEVGRVAIADDVALTFDLSLVKAPAS